MTREFLGCLKVLDGSYPAKVPLPDLVFFLARLF